MRKKPILKFIRENIPLRRKSLLRLFNCWPPFLGTGIKIKEVAPDLRSIQVEMKLRFWNANYVGTHFGGSLYAMTDPFFMMILLENLGKDYIVWDKAAKIRFKKPGKGIVSAHFQLSEAQIESIRKQADENEKVEPTFQVLVKDEQNEVVAEVEKLLYIKRKDRTAAVKS